MTDPGFTIDGVPYEMPLPSSFDIDEAEIYFKYTGFVLEEIWLDDLGWDQLKTRPGFVPALAHVAYRRANPGASFDEVRVVIGKQNRYELVGSWISSLMPDDEPSEDPKEPVSGDPTRPSATSSETESKPGKTTSPSESSGPGSTTSSGEPVVEHEITGTFESDGPAVSVPLKRVV